MTNKIALTLTPDELKDLLMARIERSLRESGVTLSDATKARIHACLPVPGAIDVRGVGDAPALDVPAQANPKAIERLRGRASGSHTDNRTRVYSPTPRAKTVAQPQSISEHVLNRILKSELCTLHDLERSTKKPRKAIYTALWQLKREGLIDVAPLSLVIGQAQN